MLRKDTLSCAENFSTSRINVAMGEKISERTHCSAQCGYQATRDLNTAQNILALELWMAREQSL
jgi:transposase